MILLNLLVHLLAFISNTDKAILTNTNTLTIEFVGIKPTAGNIIFSVYDKAEGFPEKSDTRFYSASIPVKGGKVTVPLNKIPNGTYAIAFIHDANGNGKMDKNFVGLPKEGFGFSNDAMGKFGPPSFKEASFTYSGNEKVIMKVKYL